jgi:Domain of unknown function (DUF2437)
MKLVRFESNGLPVIGVVSGDGIIRISDLLREFRQMRQLAAAGPEALARLADRAATAKPTDSLKDARLLAPKTRLFAFQDRTFRLAVSFAGQKQGFQRGPMPTYVVRRPMLHTFHNPMQAGGQGRVGERLNADIFLRSILI